MNIFWQKKRIDYILQVNFHHQKSRQQSVDGSMEWLSSCFRRSTMRKNPDFRVWPSEMFGAWEKWQKDFNPPTEAPTGFPTSFSGPLPDSYVERLHGYNQKTGCVHGDDCNEHTFRTFLVNKGHLLVSPEGFEDDILCVPREVHYISGRWISSVVSLADNSKECHVNFPDPGEVDYFHLYFVEFFPDGSFKLLSRTELLSLTPPKAWEQAPDASRARGLSFLKCSHYFSSFFTIYSPWSSYPSFA